MTLSPNPLRLLTLLALSLLVAGSVGCASTPGGPPSTSRWIQITEDATDDLIAKVEAQLVQPGFVPEIAFAGVDRDGGWELGRNPNDFREVIKNRMLSTGKIELLDSRAVEAAMKAEKIKSVKDLYLPERRKALIERLGAESARPDYLVWGVYTSVDDYSGHRGPSRHRFSIDLASATRNTILLNSTATGDN